MNRYDLGVPFVTETEFSFLFDYLVYQIETRHETHM